MSDQTTWARFRNVVPFITVAGILLVVAFTEPRLLQEPSDTTIIASGATPPSLAAANGRFFARWLGASDSQPLEIWDSDSGERLIGPRPARGPLSALAVSQDGSLVAAGRKSISVVEASTGDELLRISGQTEAVRWLGFSPDAKILASISDDHSLP